jgi:hypothetical protein
MMTTFNNRPLTPKPRKQKRTRSRPYVNTAPYWWQTGGQELYIVPKINFNQWSWKRTPDEEEDIRYNFRPIIIEIVDKC